MCQGLTLQLKAKIFSFLPPFGGKWRCHKKTIQNASILTGKKYVVEIYKRKQHTIITLKTHEFLEICYANLKI